MRNGLKALGLSFVAVLGLMAFGAVGAQAQNLTEPSKTNTPGTFQIGGAAALLASVTGAQEGPGKLLVAGRNLTIECQKGKVNAAKINTSTDASATVLFEECVAWDLNQTEKLPCTVLSAGEADGNISAAALALPILHGGLNYVLFEPQSGPFVVVELHGAECPLPLTNEVKGAISAQVTTNHNVTILGTFSSAIQLLTGDKLLFGVFPSYIDASATVTINDEAHKGKTLGVL